MLRVYVMYYIYYTDCCDTESKKTLQEIFEEEKEYSYSHSKFEELAAFGILASGGVYLFFKEEDNSFPPWGVKE